MPQALSSPRGVGTLLVHGQAEAGKEMLTHGEAGSGISMAPTDLL